MTLALETDLAYFDLFDPEFRVDSPAVRAAARANWYARTPLGLAVLRYDECQALLRDRRLRHQGTDILAAQGVRTGPLVDWFRMIILNVEGDAHTRLRRLVSGAFTARRVERLRPVMRAVADELIDGMDGTGCDFMATFADRYPARIICELLAIPPAEQPRFWRWATDLGLAFSLTVAQNLGRIEAALAGLYDCVDRLLAVRRREPGDDLVSALVAAEQDGDRLSAEELGVMVTGLVFAGHDTTRNQLGLAMSTFIEHPDQWALLAERPELAETAVEEVMRVAPTVPAISRVATQDLTFQGLDIPIGTHLMLFVAAANTEPETFGPARFDITAKRPAQLTFGGGIHYCLGAWLARMEMREALPILAARLRDPQLAGAPTLRPALGISGPVTLPIRFTPAG